MHSAVSFADIAERSDDRLRRAQGSTRKGRALLHDLVMELADGDGPVDELLDGHCWRIASLVIEGVGGVAATQPSPIEFTPVPGLTVVYGQNGQGKTSLARGLEAGLRGVRSATHESGDLWSATDITDGSAQVASS